MGWDSDGWLGQFAWLRKAFEGFVHLSWNLHDQEDFPERKHLVEGLRQESQETKDNWECQHGKLEKVVRDETGEVPGLEDTGFSNLSEDGGKHWEA